ncbi:MAG: FAD-binding protein [Gracilibacteraceae bacterium]|jgi:succinate dehydrogenase/fumarate reductase flavoprotein subunit|nr:FAD-binding protein [Gracilibacteraceae bacterium]
MNDFTVKKHAADVLIIGGGIAGLAAAIRAREHGAEVIVLEKSHAERSGNAGSGIDHIQSYVPGIHEKVGYHPEDMIEEDYGWGGNPGLKRKDLIELFVRNSGQDVIELASYGLKFHFEDGLFLFPGGLRLIAQFHYLPTSYHFEGRDIKRALTNRALELGANIINRSHVRQLLKNGEAVTGAVALGVREAVITVVNAKTTILATSGRASRLTASVTGSDSFEWYSAPSAANGSGKTLAARAGAEVVNLEFSSLASSYNLLNYSFSVGLPSGSWWPAGRVIDEDGNVIVERNQGVAFDDPDYRDKYRQRVEHYSEQRNRIAPLLEQGKTLYFDLAEATDEELNYIWWCLGHEGKTGVLKHHLEKRGVDLRKAKFPLRPGPRREAVPSGVWVRDATTETSVANLYATGNELILGGGGTALVTGYATGIAAAERAKQLGAPADVSAPFVAALRREAESILGQKDGDGWQNGERALQTLLDNYLGKPYNDRVLTQLAQLVARLRGDLRLGAGNLHELNRALEVLDLYDLAELVVAAARERKSSLGPFIRTDEDRYPREKDGVSVGVYRQDGEIRTTRLDNGCP